MASELRIRSLERRTEVAVTDSVPAGRKAEGHCQYCGELVSAAEENSMVIKVDGRVVSINHVSCWLAATEPEPETGPDHDPWNKQQEEYENRIR